MLRMREAIRAMRAAHQTMYESRGAHAIRTGMRMEQAQAEIENKVQRQRGGRELAGECERERYCQRKRYSDRKGAGEKEGVYE